MLYDVSLSLEAAFCWVKGLLVGCVRSSYYMVFFRYFPRCRPCQWPHPQLCWRATGLQLSTCFHGWFKMRFHILGSYFWQLLATFERYLCPPSLQLDSGTMSPRIPSRRMLCFTKIFQTHCIRMHITVYAWFLPKDQLTVTSERHISWFATVFQLGYNS